MAFCNLALDYVLEMTPKGNIGDLGAFHAQRKVNVAGYGARDGSSRSQFNTMKT